MILYKLLAEKHTRASADLDVPQTTLIHGEIIRRKRFLREFYKENYTYFIKNSTDLPQGIKVELGSGAGFIKDLIPDVKTSDVLELPGNDLQFSATDMPFEDSSLSAIYMIDVLHHIPHVDDFFKEAERCLKSGGKIIMIEPANTLWGRFIYKNFHHEPFDTTRVRWELPPGGPMSMANGAIPWMVFIRDRKFFEKNYPSLKINRIDFDYPFLYLLSGGVSMRQLIPGFLYPLVRKTEQILLKPLSTHLGMFMRIILEKSKPIL